MIVGVGLQDFEEGGQGGRDPFVFVPESVGHDVERRTGPAKGLELLLTQFAGDDDGGQEGEAHADADALLHGFDAGELGDMAGTDVLEGEGAIEFGAIAASTLSEQQVLASEIGRFDDATAGEGMACIATEKDSLSAQREETKGRIGGRIAHVKGKIDFAGFEFDSEGVVEMGEESDFDLRKAATIEAQDLGQAIGEDAFRRADAQRAAWFGTVANGAVALLHGEEGLFGEGLKAATRVGKHDAAAETIKERHAQFFFKRLDLRGDVGLHGVHFGRGAREVQFFSEGAKDLELADFHEGVSILRRIAVKKRIANGCDPARWPE